MIVEENLDLDFEPNAGWDTRVHSAKCGDLVRAYLIVCRRFVLVYDTLLGPKSGSWLRQAALDLAGGKPLLVVNSHADWDHYFGNMSFPEPILASRLCRQRVLGPVGSADLAKKRQEHPTCYEAVNLVAPSIAVEGETVLDGGDLAVHLLPTVGHRPDHLAMWIPEIATLFPGDCVEDPIPLVDEDSGPDSKTVGELITSLESMAALTPRWVLANHAAPRAGIEQIQANLRYLSDLQRRAASATSLDELRRDLEPEPHWGEFYRAAHAAQIGMAWDQRSS